MDLSSPGVCYESSFFYEYELPLLFPFFYIHVAFYSHPGLRPLSYTMHNAHSEVLRQGSGFG